MHQLEYVDAVQGGIVATFDGTALEVFTDRLASTTRLHRRQLFIGVSGPDRKGRYEVKLTSQAGGRGGGTTLFVGADAWPQVDTFLQAVTAELAAPPT